MYGTYAEFWQKKKFGNTIWKRLEKKADETVTDVWADVEQDWAV